MELSTHVVKNDELVGPAALVVADGVEDTAADNGGKELLDKEDQKDAADGGQVKVVDLEEQAELEWLATTHELSTAEDDNVVGDQHGGRGAEGRHGRLACDKFEVLGFVALYALKDLFEDGPKLEAKGTVEGRNAIADPAGRRHVATRAFW